MSSISGEHNCLDHEVADLTAARLRALFDGSGGDFPAFQPEAGLGSPHLVASLDDAPARPVVPFKGRVSVVAVDGGSSVLARGGNIEVIAWRAGMAAFEGHRRVGEFCPPPEVLAYNRLAIGEMLEEYMTDLPVKRITAEAPLRPVDELRWLAEWRLIEQLIDQAEPETLCLIDGSLRAHTDFDMNFQKGILRRAAEKKVYVAAVTKQTTLSLGGGLPLDLGRNRSQAAPEGHSCWYRQLNRALDPESGWLGNIYLARLHPGADKPYRVDINRFDESDIEKIFSMMAAIADDVEFCGYPYPLAAAHRLVRIDNIFRQELIDSIGRALEAKDFPPHIWEYLTGDIHDKLNADVSARLQDQNYG